MSKVRAATHTSALSLHDALPISALHVSLAVTCALMLASSGGVAGLHPRSLPVGTLVRLGEHASGLQSHSALVWRLLPHKSAARMAKVRVVTHPAVLSLCVTVIVA